jgi:hypothetical protein
VTDDLIRGPEDGCNSWDPKSLVDLSTGRVVDARDDIGNTEYLAGQSRCDDVGVIARRDGGKSIRSLDSSFQQCVSIETHAGDRLATEIRAKSTEGFAILINDGY